MYGDCKSTNPDCYFLPISNCTVPPLVDGNQTIYINASIPHWKKLVYPPIFHSRTLNWYRVQLMFYLMRFKPNVLSHIQRVAGQSLQASPIDRRHPYIAVYVRRSDKVKSKEMFQAYALRQYFDLFNDDARSVNISTVYINSEDAEVFNEFKEIDKEERGYYKLISMNVTRNVTFSVLGDMSQKQRGKIVLEFLTDLYIEANADLHVGTLTSNWCRLVDELRLALGKIIPYYTPEHKYLLDW